MAPPLGFNLYEALDITITASAPEITASYRRLAREHHPDKNPDNADATEKMQQINAAHEVLSNAELRKKYDISISGPSSYYENDDGGDGFEYATEDWLHNIFAARSNIHTTFENTFRGGDSFRSFDPSSHPGRYQSGFYETFLATMQQFRKKETLKEARLKAEREEKAARVALKKTEQDAKQEAKTKAAQDDEETQAQSWELEKVAQELIWKAKNATTAMDKRDTCLHSSFWPRRQNKAKFSCMGCLKKRGPTSFECPHCQLLQCQACLNTFHAERSAAGKSSA